MTVTLDELAIEELLHAHGSPVQEYVHLTAEAILEVAKANIHTSPTDHEDGSPHLADRGHVVPGPGMATVVFDGPYARAIELGGLEYDIYPKTARVLRFNWPKAGGVVFFAKVHHPSTEAQHFLLRAAEEIKNAPLL